MSEHEQSAGAAPNHEENTWAIADYDPWLEAQITDLQEAERLKYVLQQSEPETKRPSAGWLVPITAGYIAAVFLLTPQLAKIGADDKEPIISQDDTFIANKLNCKTIRPSLVGAARKVVKFAAKYPSTAETHLRENRVITTVYGQQDGDKGKIRLVTERQGDSNELDPSSALSIGITYRSDDGAGNRQFESLLLAAPSGETSVTRPYGRADEWVAHEHKRYQSAGNRPFDDRRSSTNGESSLIASNALPILEDAMFAIKFDYKLSTASPKDQDHSCSQSVETQ